MDPSPGQSDAPPPGQRLGFGRMFGFIIVAGMAMAILAAVVCLPPLRRLERQRRAHAELQAQVDSNDRLVAYRQREITLTKVDPVVTERLLIRQQHYQPAGQRFVAVPGIEQDPPIAAALAVQPPPPTPEHPWVATLTDRAENPRTRRGMLALAGLLLTGAMVFFSPSDRRRKRA